MFGSFVVEGLYLLTAGLALTLLHASVIAGVRVAMQLGSQTARWFFLLPALVNNSGAYLVGG